MNEKRIDDLLCCVKRHLLSAQQQHQPLCNAHEGYAVIQEELDELWDAVKADEQVNACKEAFHVAAMSLRFIYDLYEEGSRP